jgi:hypothetical protein
VLLLVHAGRFLYQHTHGDALYWALTNLVVTLVLVFVVGTTPLPINPINLDFGDQEKVEIKDGQIYRNVSLWQRGRARIVSC